MSSTLDMEWRKIYRTATLPEVFIASSTVEALVSAMTYVDALAVEPDLETIIRDAAQWRIDQSSRYRELMESHKSDGTIQNIIRTLLANSAPIASILGAWFQGLSAPGIFEDPVHLKVLALFADDMGVGKPHASRYDGFWQLLHWRGLSELATTPFHLSTHRQIADSMFALPAVVLSMSRRSDHYMPELVGIETVFRSVGILPCWEGLAVFGPNVAGLSALDLGTGRADANFAPRPLSDEVTRTFMQSDSAIAIRIRNAAQWVLNCLKLWDRSLLQLCYLSFDTWHQMAMLIQGRAREGAVYHQNYQMSGCPLSARLKDAISDPYPLIDMLANSKLVCAGDSRQSLLVNRLVGPNGAMFRVFTDEELQIIRDWIEQLGKDDVAVKTVDFPDAYAKQAGAEEILPDTGQEETGIYPASIREAYYVLQGRALAPLTRRYAVQYVNEWLARSEQSLKRSTRVLPETWHPQGLRTWLLDQHDKSGERFDQSDAGSLPSREDVIDSTLQLAPLTLIDGAWLQGFADHSLACSATGHALFETYWDELGNGQYELNHPKIYRDVLRQMGVALPPTASAAFANDERIVDDSFRLPVYWLCIGKMPQTYLPEIMGMNLAMELSGVGDGYRIAKRFLKHHGFSTRFVDLHNTIDNVASGHSAWAADAIDTYMRQVVESSEADRVKREWYRIRVGYESLAPAKRKSEKWKAFLSRLQRKPIRPVPATDKQLFHHSTVRIG